jgi:hypothetical protein
MTIKEIENSIREQLSNEEKALNYIRGLVSFDPAFSAQAIMYDPTLKSLTTETMLDKGLGTYVDILLSIYDLVGQLATKTTPKELEEFLESL